MDAVLRASLAWGLSTLFVLGVYFALAALAGNVAARLYGTTTAAVAATLIAALLFHPVRLRAQRLVDRLWMRERDAGPELLELLRRLPGTEGTAALAEAALGPLGRISGARGVLLYTRVGQSYELVGRDGEVGAAVALSAEGALARALASSPRPQAVQDLGEEAAAERLPDGIELLLPLCSRGALVGIVALTGRKRGVYGWAILRALENAAPQLALALENAKLVADGVMRDRLAALGQLAAVIVHEVKNPLGIIKVSAGGLRKRARDRDDDAAAELASCIEDEADRMDATVRRLLELARPPAPQLSPCDVGQVIRHTLDRLRPDLAAAGILVDTALDEAPRVSADAEELRRALLNLFLNAREAMPTGGRLSVRLRGEQGGVEIDVEDTGHGMDEATRRQLFRPFFTTRHGGTGLGLALVKRVVEDHKGAIRVDSRPGEGSRFTLMLPA
jgi:signal transduction histidine kinase